ncbi:hypothetical protein OAF56_04110 [Pirellulaceae bacterium]|nr:hypothetical protein [Pirellulaceae bacterium]MDB4650840.1 hypothetical protein [Pirellulaceae bacterium]
MLGIRWETRNKLEPSEASRSACCILGLAEVVKGGGGAGQTAISERPAILNFQSAAWVSRIAEQRT